MVTVPQGTQNPAYVRSRPTFCIPKTASCGRQIAVAASDLAAARRLAESTSFVGRRRLLTEVKAAFTNTRLVTLVGPGGVGKMSRFSRRRSIPSSNHDTGGRSLPRLHWQAQDGL